MSDDLKKGDAVTWNSPQGEVKGRIVRRVTRATSIKGHAVKATPDDPQYIVESDKTGAQAAHKPDALRRA